MEKTQVKAKRQSNFELLRIISMILIIAHHYAIHGGFELSKQAFSAQLFFLQVLSYGGKLGVNLFVLISGYFLVTSRCKLKKNCKFVDESNRFLCLYCNFFLRDGNFFYFK